MTTRIELFACIQTCNSLFFLHFARWFSYIFHTVIYSHFFTSNATIRRSNPIHFWLVAFVVDGDAFFSFVVRFPVHTLYAFYIHVVIHFLLAIIPFELAFAVDFFFQFLCMCINSEYTFHSLSLSIYVYCLSALLASTRNSSFPFRIGVDDAVSVYSLLNHVSSCPIGLNSIMECALLLYRSY